MVPIAKAFHSHQSRLALLLKYIRMALCVVNWLPAYPGKVPV